MDGPMDQYERAVAANARREFQATSIVGSISSRPNMAHTEDPVVQAITASTAAHSAILQEAARATGVDDPVHPKHYQGDLVMRIIEHFKLDTSFCLGNVIKYLLRHQEKAGLQDLKKAKWYLEREIERLEGKQHGGVT
jgi:hypothetical protein